MEILLQHIHQVIALLILKETHIKSAAMGPHQKEHFLYNHQSTLPVALNTDLLSFQLAL